ncbi:MAG: glycosyltransferase [Verrucomicrobiae bacterium]|nr:glycosyltransferase [Verrucomicrobiae bacterium]
MNRTGSGSGRTILFFCGQPLANAAIGQRVTVFGKFLKNAGWRVHFASVDPGFAGDPYVVKDREYDEAVEILGGTHYRLLPDGRREGISPAAYLMECRRIAKRIDQRAGELRATHIYLSTSLPACLAAAILLPKKSRQVWMDVDDWSAGQFAARGGGGLVGGIYELFERILPRLAGRRLTVCSRELQRLLPGSTLIPNFIRLEDVPPMDPRFGGDRIRVAFASGVTAYHGHIPFLETLAKRRDEAARLGFCFLGDGDCLGEVRRKVATLGLEGQVELTGRLARAEMLGRLAGMEIGILPLWNTRLNRARFPLKILDYLACGCALAASNVGMAGEALKHGENVLLSLPGDMDGLMDNVLKLAQDGDLRYRLSVQGRETVCRYGAEKVCADWAKLLEAP